MNRSALDPLHASNPPQAFGIMRGGPGKTWLGPCGYSLLLMGLRRRVVAAALIVGVGCGASRENQTSADIIRGSDDTAVHDAVTLLVITKNERVTATCTATLVAPNLLLTARH